MDIKNLRDLAKIASLCRKKGIETIKITQDSIEFKLKDVQKTFRKAQTEEPTSPIPTYTPEEVLFWSADQQAMGS